ncbi:MAG: CHAT domain-containing protein [Proteobacteria bacterium]|nr:CHAT domain-containing protein [Pseudomonadota bacterium]MBU1715537.1 CHAT domain-containing protein [Pseudomonadota bacterium]
MIESQRKTINTEAARIGFAGDKQAVYKQLVATLVETGRDGEAFSYAERGKARALIDMLAYKEDIRMKDDDTGRAKNLLIEMSKAEIKTLMASSSDIEPQTNSEADKIRGITMNARQDIAQADPEFASLITVTPPDVATLQSLLPAGETLVEYYGFDDDLFVFVVDKDGVQGLKLDAAGLAQEVMSFRTGLLSPPEAARGINVTAKSTSARQDLKKAGLALYKRLFTPIESMVKNGNLTIVPHGTLHYLPFNALFTGQEYFMARYHLRVLPSAGVMQFLQAKHEQPAGNLLAIGNPDLGDPKLDLPGAEEEARAIAGKIAESRLFTRAQATETTVKNLSGQYRYLHLATHGTFDAAHPLSSGLYMAKDGTNDGILSVGELYELSIPADLVTLSACETGLGKIANGDDVVGFTRGFLYAGTSSIVSSLWKVDDQATSILMQNFYDNLQKENKREALREAQLHVMNTYNADPYYWAAFQLTGAVQ